MNPVSHSFLDSFRLANDAASLIQLVEEIREKPMIVFASLGLPGEIVDPLPIWHSLIHELKGPGLDLFVPCLRLGLRGADYRLYTMLMHRFQDYTFLGDSLLEDALCLALGAKERILGERAEFGVPTHFQIRVNERYLSLGDLKLALKTFGRDAVLQQFSLIDLLPLLNREIGEREKYAALLKVRYEPEQIREMLDFLFEHPGPAMEGLGHQNLAQAGISWQPLYRTGVMGSLHELQTGILQTLQVQSRLEGADPEKGVDFVAQARIVAILQTRSRRFLCFRFQDLPNQTNVEYVWAEK